MTVVKHAPGSHQKYRQMGLLALRAVRTGVCFPKQAGRALGPVSGLCRGAVPNEVTPAARNVRVLAAADVDVEAMFGRQLLEALKARAADGFGQRQAATRPAAQGEAHAIRVRG